MKLPPPIVLYLLAPLNLLIATAIAQLPWLEPKSAPVYAAIAEFTFMLSLAGPWLLLASSGRHLKASIAIILLAIPQAYWLYLNYLTGKPAMFLIVPFTVIPTLLYFFYLYAKKPERLDARTIKLMPMVVFMSAMFLTVASFLRVTVILHPVYDLTIMSFQAQIGLAGFETLVRSWFPWKSDVTLFVTICYMTILPASVFMLLLVKTSVSSRFFVAWTIPTIVGYFMFWLTPAVGPTVAASYFPDAAITTINDTYLYADGLTEIRNAIPSLHVVWALLLVFFARGFSRMGFILITGYAAANILVTVASGGHWTSDVVTAIPLTAIGLYFAQDKKLPLAEHLGTLLCVLSMYALTLGLRYYPDFIITYAVPCTAFMLLAAVVGMALCWRWTEPKRLEAAAG